MNEIDKGKRRLAKEFYQNGFVVSNAFFIYDSENGELCRVEMVVDKKEPEGFFRDNISSQTSPGNLSPRRRVGYENVPVRIVRTEDSIPLEKIDPDDLDYMPLDNWDRYTPIEKKLGN